MRPARALQGPAELHVLRADVAVPRAAEELLQPPGARQGRHLRQLQVRPRQSASPSAVAQVIPPRLQLQTQDQDAPVGHGLRGREAVGVLGVADYGSSRHQGNYFTGAYLLGVQLIYLAVVSVVTSTEAWTLLSNHMNASRYGVIPMMISCQQPEGFVELLCCWAEQYLPSACGSFI